VAFSLGLERSGGFKTMAFCEIDPYCRAVLKKHWPDVPCYDDIRNLTAETLRRDGIAVDAICGGFPCQDISIAGKGAGIGGERSGLWSEYARLIGEIRPRYVIVENVAALLGRGMGDVFGNLAALGYDAEWDTVPASELGAPHRRERVWIVAYAPGDRLQRKLRQALAQEMDDISSQALGPWHGPGNPFEQWSELLAKPSIRRMADGVPSTLDIRPRLRVYGNAVVPQIPEIIGRAILASMEASNA
jgi:DNA (cytosine-5)-methyltransferase 1